MSSTLLSEIMKLPPEERLSIADEIYASMDMERGLAGEVEEKTTEMMPGQRAELERIIAEYEANPDAETFAAEDVLEEIRRLK